MPTREFQNVLMADKIGARIGRRVLQRVAHARLRRQMQDDVERLARRYLVQSTVLGDVGLHEAIIRTRHRSLPAGPVFSAGS